MMDRPENVAERRAEEAGTRRTTRPHFFRADTTPEEAGPVEGMPCCCPATARVASAAACAATACAAAVADCVFWARRSPPVGTVDSKNCAPPCSVFAYTAPCFPSPVSHQKRRAGGRSQVCSSSSSSSSALATQCSNSAARTCDAQLLVLLAAPFCHTPGRPVPRSL